MTNSEIYSLILAGYSLQEIAEYFDTDKADIMKRMAKIFAEKGIKSITIKSKL